MKFPDMSKECVLTTGASDIALGYILGQKDDEGREAVICCGGRSVRKTKRSYSACEKEMLALTEALNFFKAIHRK